MKTADFIREYNVCHEGAEWALSISDNMAEVWDELLNQGKHGWLIWTATRPGVLPDSVMRKLACRFVRKTPIGSGRTVWDLLTDERSRKAIEVVEAYADGKATADELSAARAAARDASYDAEAACAAAYAAARAAAYYDARAAYHAARAAVCAARAAAKSAQIKMIAQLGNPFKKES